ncbi:MAG: hypothetical protein AB1689_04190 [Thermodesulfobacteriota bacterium]
MDRASRSTAAARGRSVALALAVAIALAACGDRSTPDPEPPGPLPPNPQQWICETSPRATRAEIDAWCLQHPDRGRPLPDELRNPPQPSDFDAWQAYNLRLEQFLTTNEFASLGWVYDARWRFSGPSVVAGGSYGNNYGPHFPLRVYYSPEVVDWLCSGRQGNIPDGAMIMKAMTLSFSTLDIRTAADGCMDIVEDPDEPIQPILWAPMIKTSGSSYDGWYWTLQQPNVGIPPQFGPPLLDRSAFTGGTFPDPIVDDPKWYPTGGVLQLPLTKVPNVVPLIPLAGHAYCLSCHATAEAESTFASMDNILGRELRYRAFAAQDGPVPTPTPVPEPLSPFPSPLPAPSELFLTFFDQLEPVTFPEVWQTRMPAETWDDQVISGSGGPGQFLTSAQCDVCHNATPQSPLMPQMVFVEQEVKSGSPLVNLSPSGEWRVSPMGLSGRDPIFSNSGERLGASYEQSTHLEWLNSDSGRPGEGFRSCQDCHMPTTYRGTHLEFAIANSESGTRNPPTTNRLPDDEIDPTPRDRYSRHALHGLNVFLNQMFQQFPLLLGFQQIDFMSEQPSPIDPPAPPFSSAYPMQLPLFTGFRSMLDMARGETALVEVDDVRRESGELQARVTVRNQTGHYLPTAVGFRRTFVELLVLDAQDEVLWASGRTNELGFLVDGTTDRVLESEQPLRFPLAPVQPHYQTITSSDQVQIYQELIRDSDGLLTTSFLRRVDTIKDNRIRPKGYDPQLFARSSSPYIQELAVLHGAEAQDPHYFDPRLTGSDVIEYRVPLDPATLARADRVQATLYYQSIPPFYLQDRFADASAGPAHGDDIRRLYYMTSHFNVDGAIDRSGEPVLRGWKLRITGASAAIR